MGKRESLFPRNLDKMVNRESLIPREKKRKLLQNTCLHFAILQAIYFLWMKFSDFKKATSLPVPLLPKERSFSLPFSISRKPPWKRGLWEKIWLIFSNYIYQHTIYKYSLFQHYNYSITQCIASFSITLSRTATSDSSFWILISCSWILFSNLENISDVNRLNSSLIELCCKWLELFFNYLRNT